MHVSIIISDLIVEKFQSMICTGKSFWEATFNQWIFNFQGYYEKLASGYSAVWKDFIHENFFYRLQIYEKDFQRPDICAQWDPENPLCQILGKYKLRLDSQPGVLPR